MLLSRSNEMKYIIKIEGHLGADWIDWPFPVETRHAMDESRQHAITILSVTLPDQPALHALLEKIRDLNLTLIAFQRLDR